MGSLLLHRGVVIRGCIVTAKFVSSKRKPGVVTANSLGRSRERDVLGKLANLHLALCDKLGRDGPKSEDCIYLSHLQSIAVDFAKHGECVSKEEYEGLDKLITEWPDFFEKPWKKIRKSNGILGKLFRDINNEKAVEELLRDDW